jgi:ribosomal-protein-alanine N-acetyltransferase
VHPTRLVTLDDVPALTRLLVDSREFMTPYEPSRPEEYFTEARQHDLVAEALEACEQGLSLPHVILDDEGAVAGRITLNTIVRGPFLSCAVGYWVGVDQGGRGLATRAVAEIKRVAFDDLGLHRIEASTLLDNVRSQRVLDRNGFTRIGLAPNYLKIDGRWQDMAIYQVLTTKDV